ncbi:MAG: GNAT family N-acetyltransferase [Verrucomicrobia bacterium]|nr:GNAT family N-acetyltransferase [Verrucomicrobiota bacterium]
MRPLERRTPNPDFITRPYEKRDRAVIRRICCETGFLGDPIDSVFSDRDLFADYLTRYYTDVEPESCWVGEKDGAVVTYLIGCGRWRLHRWWSVWNGLRMAAKAASRFVRGRYDAKDRKFLGWVLTRGWRETPWAPAQAAHFHFNSLKEHRKMGIARDLLMTLFEEMKKRGVRRVYGQMITYNTRRTEKVYEYLGWKVADKKRVTKYDGVLDKEMYLTTVVRELED